MEAKRPNSPRGRSPEDNLRRLQGRLRDVAKQQPGRKFHALYDRFYRRDVLNEAWNQVRRNQGAAGADAQTIAAIEQDGVERLLEAIHGELREKWLTHRSAMGFPRGVMPRSCELLGDEDEVIPRAGEQILTAAIQDPRTGEPRLLLAGHGNTADIDADDRIADLVRELWTRPSCNVGDLVARFAGERITDAADVHELEPETIRALLTLFVTWHTLDRASPSAGA